MEKCGNPDQIHSGTLFRVISSARSILELYGQETKTPLAKIDGGDPDLLSAEVLLDSSNFTTVPKDVLATVGINKPIGDFAKQARWLLEITYNMREGNDSRHILVLRHELPTAELTFHDGRPDRYLTEQEAQAVAADLSRIAEIEP